MKRRVKVQGPDKIGLFRALLELTKSVLSGIVRAVVADWLHRH
ncbi:hypothetical protein [Hymenobacter actinosclerus]|nr:hypothetical protein [Hymenobacter actinosclerus]